MDGKVLLEFHNINKSFSGVPALKNVSFQIKAGQIHALLGENGAGKSTLMKTLSGAYQRDSGEIVFEGKKCEFKNTDESEKQGISIIYQELNMIPELSVAENIFIHRQPLGPGGMINWPKMYKDAEKVLAEVGLDVKPTDLIKTLSVAQQQMVEIAKALTKNLKLLIMDEPTSSLSTSETETLFKVIRELQAKGITIVYISHRMEEIFALCDSYTIMRDGEVIISDDLKNTNINEIIKHMVGREMNQIYPHHEFNVGETILSAEHLSNGAEVKDVSFELRDGEILGFAGLVGAGRTETFKALFGFDRNRTGTIYMNGKEVKISSPADAIRCGIAYVPEDRRNEGLVTSLPVGDNILMAKMENAFDHGFFSPKKAAQICEKFIKALLIKTQSAKQKAVYLSGGNQQKVVLAKWLNCDAKILILDEPTRGIDVNAKSEIYKMIDQLVDQGKSVILISSEMNEIIGMCNRVYVMYEGRITGELQQKELSQENIMRFAAGGKS